MKYSEPKIKISLFDCEEIVTNSSSNSNLNLAEYAANKAVDDAKANGNNAVSVAIYF